MRDAGLGDDLVSGNLAREVGHPLDATDAIDARAIDERHAAGVVAAVFEAPQPLDQDRNDVAPGGGADDAAHG
jgi:hypothetical protein